MANKISPNMQEWGLRFLLLFMGISIGLSPLAYYKPKSENLEIVNRQMTAGIWELMYEIENFKNDLSPVPKKLERKELTELAQRK